MKTKDQETKHAQESVIILHHNPTVIEECDLIRCERVTHHPRILRRGRVARLVPYSRDFDPSRE
jgi:hypothetical protein